MAMNKFQTKAKLLEVLGKEYERIEDAKNDMLQEYRNTGELIQSTRYNRETGEYDLVWEDEEETVPAMKEKWDYVTLSPTELCDEKKAEYDAYNTILKALEKLM